MMDLRSRKLRVFGPYTPILLILTLFTSLSCVGGGENPIIPGVKGPNIKLEEERVRVSMTFTEYEQDMGVRLKIPGTEDSYVEVGPDFESSGTLMLVDLSIQDLIGSSYDQLPKLGLPGGRALPGIPGGRLAASEVPLNAFPAMTTYFSSSHWGLFVPVNLDFDGVIPLPYFKDGKMIGTLSLVGKGVMGDPSGFLLMIDLDKKVKKVLHKRLR